MMHRAVWVPNDPVSLVRLEGLGAFAGNPRLREVWEGAAFGPLVPDLQWRLAGRPPGAAVRGVRDDNRSAIFPEQRVVVRDREYVVSVKGCGTATDAFVHAPISADRLRSICHDAGLSEALAHEDGIPDGFITGERWYGNAPYGGQAPDSAAIGLLTSLRADVDDIAGFRICPVLAILPLPDAVARIASAFYWYRQYEGTFWQEIRLVPSNLRLYFHSPITFGVDTAHAFTLLQLESYEACETFLGNLARSALSALTLYARTLRHDSARDRYVGLEYHDVWLDKDAVIAADGTMFFADVEGIEDAPAQDAGAVRERTADQFHRNVYEATYALEAMAQETQRRWGTRRDEGERRAWLLDIMERACLGDPYARLERRGDSLRLVTEPAVDADVCSIDVPFADGLVP